MYLFNAPSLIEMQISFLILSVFYQRNHILTSVDTTYKKKKFHIIVVMIH